MAELTTSPAALRALLRLGWPAMLRGFVNCAADRATLSLVGHWDDTPAHFDTASLGKMYSNITGLSLGFGVNMGLATLCSQAFGAGRSAAEAGVHLRRASVIHAALLLVSGLAAGFAEPLLLSMGQPADVARCSARFALLQLPGVPLFWLSNALQTACDGAQRPRPGLYARCLSAGTTTGFAVLAVSPQILGWGYLGLAAARSLGGLVELIAMLVLVRRHEGLADVVWRRGDRALRIFSARALWQYMRVALPAAAIMWTEWWSFEAQAVMAGLLPDARVSLGAHGTLFNLLVVCYMAFTGLGTALCALTGRAIGERAGHVVPRLCAVAGLVALAISAAVAGIIYGARTPLARAFTSDERVVDMIARCSLGPAVSVPGYAIFMTLFGALRGASRQRGAATGALIGYGLVGLPLAAYLGLVAHMPHGRPLLGIWIGNAAALAFASAWTTTIVCRLDWAHVQPSTLARPRTRHPASRADEDCAGAGGTTTTATTLGSCDASALDEAFLPVPEPGAEGAHGVREAGTREERRRVGKVIN